MAASGEPNICLTLTINVATGESPNDRYKILHNSWKLLAKRVIRQFKLPAERRWTLKTPEGYEYQDITSFRITRNTEAGKINRLHYMAFAEETEQKEPHLHILLRTDYIPQSWISQQMKELQNSPIVWIEKIKGPRAAISYVTKYVTEAPAQFGTSKRYWVSRDYQLTKQSQDEVPMFDRKGTRLRQISFSEFVREIVIQGQVPIKVTTREFRVLPLREALKQYGSPYIDEPHEAWVAARIWLLVWKHKLRI